MNKSYNNKILMLCFICIFFGCDRTTSPNIIEVSDQFELKVNTSIKTILLDFYKDTRLKKLTKNELIKKYQRDYFPIDSSLRVLLRLKVSSLDIKTDLDELDCVYKIGTQVDLYYWVPIIQIMEIVELEHLLSVNSKGMFRTR